MSVGLLGFEEFIESIEAVTGMKLSVEENGGVMVCDVCGGDPRCVEVCQKQALLFV